MGNRVKGRPKQKSIKAASHSKMGSKRKLSRMGKKQKANNSGLEATFIGRSKCLKMLQVTIKDFRRLCILKGIYPREPRGRVPGKKKGQTFYHIKDIRAIAHEPILEKFREFRSFMKKIRRAAGRNERDEAARKNAVCPTYTLHHLVRERYPRFEDALSDLDDALTLTYLFAALPTTTAIKAKMGSKAKAIAAAWGAYCSTAGCITKSFISVKGVYLEANIRGIPIRWVVPHSFTQFLPEDVDYRVMATFFEFYETLLHFVLFKLYNDLGVRYPLPEIEAGGEVKGSTSFILSANLRSLGNAMNSSTGAITKVVTDTLEGDQAAAIKGSIKHKSKEEKRKERELINTVGAALDNIKEDENGSMDDDEDEEEDEAEVDVAGPLKAALETLAEDEARAMTRGDESNLDDDALKRRRLFAGLTFFLSREVPRGYLELVALAYGAKVGWEGPNSSISANDPSITHHIVDRPTLLSSYSSLPKSREFVQPQWILDCANFMFLLPIAKYGVGVLLPPHLSPWVDNEEEGYKPAYAEEIERLKNGEPIEMIQEEAEKSDTEEMFGDKEAIDDGKKDNEKEEEEEAEEEESDDDNQAKKKESAERRRKKEEKEAHELAKSMMSRKAAHLYGRMQHGIAQKQAKVEALSTRRREIEHSKEKDETGKTPLKQKVERLKKERKRIEDEYSNTGGSMKKSKKRRA
ncbi:Pescadillo family domain containing protein [Nitzschia inconspicua]|uniref:Pescadillo homolog n=1 Tax=Nitzschia inconspicua TaxID=303405 RepID=A0A9K3KN22_9STRA|nr:Pescadillo family domain containing protein [Nitzschia inconspicua]